VEVISMKLMATTLLLALLATVPALAAPRTWKGQITDSTCGATHMAAEDGKKMSDAECAKACVEHGAQYVFVSRGKTYKIANQHHPDVLMHAGHVVNLRGELNGDTIMVLSADMP
jgi:hypothetical protein